MQNLIKLAQLQIHIESFEAASFDIYSNEQ